MDIVTYTCCKCRYEIQEEIEFRYGIPAHFEHCLPTENILKFCYKDHSV
jgi:hypothetical protein